MSTALPIDTEPLSVLLETRDGSTYSLTARDQDEGSVPYDISWGTQNPGGYADASVTLRRPPFDAQNLLFARSNIGDGKHKGRVKNVETDSEATTLTIEGLSALLDDNSFYRFLGVHNDLSQWTTAPIPRQLELAFFGIYPITESGVETDASGLPAATTRMTAPSDSLAGVATELWLRPDGMEIGRVQGTWAKGEFVDEGDANYRWQVFLSDDNTAALLDDPWEGSTGNLISAGPGSFSVTATGAPIYAVLSFEYGAALVGDGTPLDIRWVPSVFGDHAWTAVGLPDGRYGLRSESVLTDAVEFGTTDLDVFDIQAADFVCAHVVHTGTPRELIEQVSAFGTNAGRIPHWGVYENGFFWGDPGDFGTTWLVNRNQTATATDSGPNAEEMCSGVVITYSNGAGETLSVGPVGSGADFETADLSDVSVANLAPSNRIKVRDAGLTTQEGAVLIGQALLAETNNQPHTGTVTVVGDLRDTAGNIRHASEVRACDRMVIADDETPEEQDVVSTTYDHNTQTATANLGLAPTNIETLLARLAASVQGL